MASILELGETPTQVYHCIMPGTRLGGPFSFTRRSIVCSIHTLGTKYNSVWESGNPSGLELEDREFDPRHTDQNKD